MQITIKHDNGSIEAVDDVVNFGYWTKDDIKSLIDVAIKNSKYKTNCCTRDFVFNNVIDVVNSTKEYLETENMSDIIDEALCESENYLEAV